MELEYSISVSDGTPWTGQSKARGETYQHRFGAEMDGRRSLEEILARIDSQIPTIERHIAEMLANPGTKVIQIHGRFPVRQDYTVAVHTNRLMRAFLTAMSRSMCLSTT